MSIDLDHTGREGRAARPGRATPPPEPPTRPSRRLKAWRAACVVSVLAMVAAAFLFIRIRNDPSIVLVYSRGGADWIRIPEAPRLSRRDLGDYQTSFRSQFTLAMVPTVANLEFRAHHDAKVYVNSVRVANTRHAADRWKETRIVNLAAQLRPGTNMQSGHKVLGVQSVLPVLTRFGLAH